MTTSPARHRRRPRTSSRPTMTPHPGAVHLDPAPGTFLDVLLEVADDDRGPAGDLAREVANFATTDPAMRAATSSPSALRAHLERVVPGARPEMWTGLDDLERRYSTRAAR